MGSASAIEEGVQRLFEAGLELALQIQADAMAAETPEARAKLAISFHRVSRGVRQTAALKTKLARDAERAERQSAAEAEARRETRVASRKAAVSRAIDRILEAELDDDEQLDAYEDLATRLDAEALDDGFLDEPVNAQIARICQALDLPSPLAGEGGPRRGPDEGSHDLLGCEQPASASEHPVDSPPAGATPHPTASGGHLLPQGEKGDELEFDAAPPPPETG